MRHHFAIDRGVCRLGELGEIGDNHVGVGADLAELTKTADPSVYREMVAHWCNPDGQIDMASLKKDLAFFREQGDVKADIKPEQVVDTSFAEAALKELGPYKAAAK